MVAIILNGKKLADEREHTIRESVAAVVKKSGRSPRLDVILANDSPATHSYVSRKMKIGREIGIEVVLHKFPETVESDEITKLVKQLNLDRHIDGLIVQLPLPKHVRQIDIFDLIDPLKDVDCLTPLNVGKLWKGDTPYFYPCTPLSVIDLIRSTKVDFSGGHAVIVGRSNIVGKPLIALLLSENLTVTACHSRSDNLFEITRSGNILVSAVGKPNIIRKDMVGQGAIVIDVGISRVQGSLVGDVEFDQVKEKAAFISPVPGGVGPLTVSHLMENVVKAAGSRL